MNGPTSADTTVYTIQTFTGTIDSGTGRIGIWGKAAAMATLNYGIALHNNLNGVHEVITSANRTAQAITIVGESRPSTAVNSRGINSVNYAAWNASANASGYQGVRILATGLKNAADLANFPGGGISITGYGSSSTATTGIGIYLNFIDILAKDGPINLTGYDSRTDGTKYGAGIYFGTDNTQDLVRIGGYNAYNTATTSTYTNLANTVTDFATSSSNITISASKFVFLENVVAAGGYRYAQLGLLWSQTVQEITGHVGDVD
jgi:hypothetical protein